MDESAAKAIVLAADEALDKIAVLLERINEFCLQDDRKKYQLVLGSVIAELDLEILEKIYREFPSLRPEGLEEIR